LRAKLSKLLICCAVLFLGSLPATAQSAYSNTDLDTLVGPIALYPDELLSNVIRAATFPDQVVAASSSGTVNDSWDASVKAIDVYPDVVSMMAGNLTWTKSLGWAASNQLADLMDAVQRFRYRAQQAGNLSTDGKVQVIQEGSTIRIEPANPQVIYVPTYNPVYVDDDDFGEAFVYGAAVATSAYLWSNVYHWNNNAWYSHPYGWYPPASYYRPYGWQNAGVYTGNAVRLNGGNNVVRGPVTVNNVNVNRNTARVYNNNSTKVNSARVNRSYSNVNNVNNVNRTRVQAESRSWNRSSTPNWGSYGVSGQTVRESNRGATSRQSLSVSSGARMGGGARGGRRR
jgi:hypothetical protein